MNKLLRWGIISVTTFSLASCNLKLYSSVPDVTQHRDVEAQLNHLKAALEQGADEQAQSQFPEGQFLTQVFYGLSWVNVGLSENLDPSIRETALFEARQAYARLGSPDVKAQFNQSQKLPHGIFYLGWRNYLLSGILLLQQPSPLNKWELQEFQGNCEAIADALDANDSPFLPSYYQETWPAHNFPALLSLRGHTTLVNRRYEPIIERWLDNVQPPTAAETPFLDHRHQPSVEGPRGSSQALIHRFLPDLDPDWAAQSYRAFRQTFLTRRFGLPATLEYPPELYPEDQVYEGDIDSGPLLTGISLSATALTLGAARMNGDEALYQALWQTNELVGQSSGRTHKRYWWGLSPLGDAVLLWSQTATPWFSSPIAPVDAEVDEVEVDGGDRALDYPRWWRWPSHSISLLLWIGGMCLVSDRRKARKQRRKALNQRRQSPPTHTLPNTPLSNMPSPNRPPSSPSDGAELA